MYPLKKLSLMMLPLAFVLAVASLSFGNEPPSPSTPDNTEKAIEVIFEKENAPDPVKEKYPFMSEIIDRIIDNAVTAPEENTISLSVGIDTRADQGGKDIYFLNVRGADYCGSLGCTVMAYIKLGDQYHQALNLTTDATIKLINTSEKTQIILCSGPNGSVWDLNGTEFVHVKGTDDTTPNPACEAPPAATAPSP